jgi:hypothetical protein
VANHDKIPSGDRSRCKRWGYFSGIWLCVTGISGSRRFERSYFLHLQEFRSGPSKTRPVGCRMWPTQMLIFKTFYSLYSYGIMHSRNPAKFNAKINLLFFFVCENFANEKCRKIMNVTFMLWLKMSCCVSYLLSSLFWVGKGWLRRTSGTAYPWYSVLSQINGFLKDTTVTILKLA